MWFYKSEDAADALPLRDLRATGTRRLTLRGVRLFALAAILAALTPPFADVTYAQAGAPTLTATVQLSGGVAVSWTAVAGADSYQVWRWRNGAWTQLDNRATPRALAYTDANVAAGQSYHYIVAAVVAGRRGAWSESVLVSLPPTLTASAVSATSVTLGWDAVDGADSYQLWRWRDGAWTQIGGALTATTYTDGALAAATQYWYIMRAVTDAGPGPWSNQVSIPPPPTLTATVAATGATSVTLGWDAVDGADSYQLWRWRNGVWTQLDNAGDPRGLSYTDANVSLGQRYWYTVAAVIAGHLGAWSEFTLVALTPAAPTLTESAAGATSVTLAWDAVDGADSYQLWRWRNGVWTQLDNAGAPNGLFYTDANVSLGERYRYTVAAVIAGHLGAWSEFTLVALTPAAPTLTASAAGATSVTLAWDAVDGADSYELWRWQDGAWTQIGGALTATTYTDSALASATKYWYIMRAVNTAGAGPWSNYAPATTLSPAPTPTSAPVNTPMPGPYWIGEDCADNGRVDGDGTPQNPPQPDYDCSPYYP